MSSLSKNSVQRKTRSAIDLSAPARGGLALFAAAVLFSSPALAVPKELFFDSAGVQIRYTDQGTGAPVVLVHGFAVNADINWGLPGITAALAKEFRVITLDLRGHGRSGKPHLPAAYGAEMAQDVVRLLDHLEIGRAHVVGYSLGGAIALKLATTNAERLITVAPCGIGWEPPDNGEFYDAMEQTAKSLESGNGVGPLSEKLGGKRPKPSWTHKMWVRFVTSTLNDKRALAAVIRSLRGLAISKKELSRIAIPVCTIVGGKDSLRASVDRMQGKVKDHKVVIIEGADHISATSRPEMIDSLMAFLRAHSED